MCRDDGLRQAVRNRVVGESGVQPSTPRRRFQFRLRTLMIGVAIAAALSGLGRYVVNEQWTVQGRKAWLADSRVEQLPFGGEFAVLDTLPYDGL
jgi:hypothetical protein